MQLLEDPGAGPAVAIGVVLLGHAAIGGRVVQQAVGIGDDLFDIGADQARRARGDAFGALGVLAHHQHRLAE